MNNDQLASAITKSLGYVENGGHPHLNNPSAGKTGELRSIFQYTPGTWAHYSEQVLGKVAPLNPDTETYVTLHKVKDWLTKYSPEQIFSMWNAGPGEPDAYTGKFSNGHPSVGVNHQYGVKYDVPSYVQKGMNYLHEFLGNSAQSQQQNTDPLQSGLQKLTSLFPAAGDGSPSGAQPNQNPNLSSLTSLFTKS